LIQRLYIAEEGQVLLDGADLSQIDPAWRRSQIGVVKIAAIPTAQNVPKLLHSPAL